MTSKFTPFFTYSRNLRNKQKQKNKPQLPYLKDYDDDWHIQLIF